MSDSSDPYAPYYGQVYPGMATQLNRSNSKAVLVGWSYETPSGIRIQELVKEIQKVSPQDLQVAVNDLGDILKRNTSDTLVTEASVSKRLNPEIADFKMPDGPSSTEVTSTNTSATEASSSRETTSSEASSAEVDPLTETASPKQSVKSNSGKLGLPHPLTWDPRVDILPYNEFTDTSPECAAIGKYLSRPHTPKPNHPFMTSTQFTIIIRFEGPFDCNGRQPGLIIPQTEHFTLRVLQRGYVPGERKVEIWRNGETFQLFGLIGVFADECGWFLGDTKLRYASEGRYSGRVEGQKLLEAVKNGQP